ncbi:hypothetical protein P175DRAFT_0130721 [Aspergillus ochraceoroseus IBT 24754]|uniref:Uncharacterized protein n=1 Tax=Aspergillus ochraceoroseus IBT 24754 TaxID=1392256 RepID=A0A2T5M1I7_9EURO|nr:uncharacterized protein P175DRAFT_0130721 [Aspergillus ochraceoroseus IBT 24754]PTU22394.1 hypothetical protein P175DRAFT_0130721 [Aspergillus ochraceoroseus IBT 24754]
MIDWHTTILQADSQTRTGSQVVKFAFGVTCASLFSFLFSVHISSNHILISFHFISFHFFFFHFSPFLYLFVGFTLVSFYFDSLFMYVCM